MVVLICSQLRKWNEKMDIFNKTKDWINEYLYEKNNTKRIDFVDGCFECVRPNKQSIKFKQWL